MRRMIAMLAVVLAFAVSTLTFPYNAIAGHAAGADYVEKDKGKPKKETNRTPSSITVRAELARKRAEAEKRRRAAENKGNPPKNADATPPPPCKTMKDAGMGNSTACWTPGLAYQFRLGEYKECEGSQLRDKNGKTIGAADTARDCGTPPKRPKEGEPAEAGTEVPVFTAEQVAYMAVAELTLPDMKIAMGPDPSWNEWDSVVVGHPYWFWSDSPTSLPSVSETVGPLTVSLEPRLKGIGFDMGDGNSLSCPSGGSRYSRASTRIGAKSPDCGYTFTKKGTHQVAGTANWEITWRVNGESGTIMMSTDAARTVPVIELQAVNVDPPR